LTGRGPHVGAASRQPGPLPLAVSLAALALIVPAESQCGQPDSTGGGPRVCPCCGLSSRERASFPAHDSMPPCMHPLTAAGSTLPSVTCPVRSLHECGLGLSTATVLQRAAHSLAHQPSPRPQARHGAQHWSAWAGVTQRCMVRAAHAATAFGALWIATVRSPGETAASRPPPPVTGTPARTSSSPPSVLRRRQGQMGGGGSMHLQQQDTARGPACPRRRCRARQQFPTHLDSRRCAQCRCC
jgi:hypothetical protein